MVWVATMIALLKRSDLNRLDRAWKRVQPYFVFPAAVSLLAQIEDYLKFTDALKRLLMRWTEITRAVWQRLIDFLPFVDIEVPGLVLDYLTFLFFTGMAAWRAQFNAEAPSLSIRLMGFICAGLVFLLLSLNLLVEYFDDVARFPAMLEVLAVRWSEVARLGAASISDAVLYFVQAFWTIIALLIAIVLQWAVSGLAGPNTSLVSEDEPLAFKQTDEEFMQTHLGQALATIATIFFLICGVAVIPALLGDSWVAFWLLPLIYMVVLFVSDIGENFFLRSYRYTIQLVLLVGGVLALDWVLLLAQDPVPQ